MSAPPRAQTTAPGMHLTHDGAAFRIFAGPADRVWLSLGDAGRAHLPLEAEGEGWWSARVPGLTPGTRYAVHADGPFAPERGHRYNGAAALLDPYARAVDAAGHAVLIDPSFDWGDDTAPRHPWARTVIYEAHVRGLTMTHPQVPMHLRGTYAAVAHPAIIEHLHRIGVTAIELLPVHAYLSEPALLQRGLVNYWGYNTLAFFAPHPGYAAARDPRDVVTEFKAMVKALHAAGIEVLLDVVYNHTAEQGGDGPALSWRGLDNAGYYRLDDFGRDVDMTGCGNTLDTREPVVLDLVLDSLRYWVQEMHVDGFRFDLAVALARDKFHDYSPDHPFLTTLREDPVLGATKLIVEPWDVGMGGWRTGAFPAPYVEWNDRFRDDVRTFWLTDLGAAYGLQPGHGARDLATRMSGSQDLFGDRGPLASINFVAAHDGFTTADLTAYNEKHNEANGEGNRDGASHNRSWNHTVEGPSDDPMVLELRRRSMRNLLATLLLSAGVPMINAGDEFGRSQGGNNNAYCQDNEIGWLGWGWQPWQGELVEHVATLARLRREHAELRSARFFTGEPHFDGGPADVAWRSADGWPLDPARWHDPGMRTLSMLLGRVDPDSADILIVINGATHEVDVTLPEVGERTAYDLLWDSAREPIGAGAGERRPAGSRAAASGASMQVWASAR